MQIPTFLEIFCWQGNNTTKTQRVNECNAKKKKKVFKGETNKETGNINPECNHILWIQEHF